MVSGRTGDAPPGLGAPYEAPRAPVGGRMGAMGTHTRGSSRGAHSARHGRRTPGSQSQSSQSQTSGLQLQGLRMQIRRITFARPRVRPLKCNIYICIYYICINIYK